MYLYNTEFILGSNIIVATATVLVYDLLITLDEEISHIWLQPLSLGTLLFLVNRYLPFVDTTMALYLQMSHTTPQQCQNFYRAITWMIAVGLCMSELILLLRTWAVWNRKRSIFILLGTMSSLTFGPGIVFTYLEIASYKFEEVPLGGVGCHLVKASKLIMVPYVLLAFSETVVVALTLKKGIEYLRNSRVSWGKNIFRHGFLFYIYLLMITIINMVVPLVGSQPLYKNYLAIPSRVFHSIFCNRVILLISKQRTHHSQGSVSLTRQRSITKSNLTTNILESAIITDDFTRSPDEEMLHSEVLNNEHEMTYTRDWTR